MIVVTGVYIDVDDVDRGRIQIEMKDEHCTEDITKDEDVCRVRVLTNRQERHTQQVEGWQVRERTANAGQHDKPDELCSGEPGKMLCAILMSDSLCKMSTTDADGGTCETNDTAREDEERYRRGYCIT